MSRQLTIDDHVIQAQGAASAPVNSAWVSANAGSGKTYVLAQRVVRLLLAGVEPSRILCLTYTKAAAGEMSNRVFDKLGEWVSLSDADLGKELTSIEGHPASPEQLSRARILFARALETPGGLKIQTIHAFCEALLHQFPLEANVPGTFTVMDDAMQKQLMAQARQNIARVAHGAPDSPVGAAFLAMMEGASDEQIDKALGEVVDNRENLANWLATMGGPDGATDHARARLGFSSNETVEGLVDQAVAASLFKHLNCLEIADFAAATGEMRAGEFADHLRAYAQVMGQSGEAEAIDALLLTKSGSLRKFSSYPSKSVAEAFPDLREQLAQEGERWVAAKARIAALRVIENTRPLLVIAQAMIADYGTAKRQRGLLDFDDLIERTADLLSRSDARAWVLYKLDLGIDHVLLDEAQDTSPKQWQIITALVEEFFVGQSARLTNRTVFAVGDEKQSIYSFRGAEPRNFAAQKKLFLKQAEAAEKTFRDVGLNLSFRSTTDVLGAVDAVFSFEDHAKGVTFEEPPQPHTAARRGDPGSVDVWDLIEAAEGDDPENWHTPVDFGGQHQALLLADKIADQLQNWIGNEVIEATGKPIEAGDILVLVRSRDRFVAALNRALKARGIAVSGADRLTITDHIAVQDLVAVGQVTLTPEDDLSLAAVLKCPLIGLNDADLYDLNQGRFPVGYELSLFEALEHAQAPLYREALETLRRWQDLSDQLPPYEFYALILGAQGGRKALLARLGGEAEDVIDAFLDAALQHDQSGTPGLQAFLSQLLDEKPEIKREMDRTAGEVRIMTVHAAKGLEAPIVFLVDKCSPAYQPQHAPALYRWPNEGDGDSYFWVHKSDDHSPTTRGLLDLEKQRAEEEYRRLLYVGMTRAEDRLIVCGYRGSRTPSSPNWHAMVTRALEPEWKDVLDADGNLLWHRWKAQDSPTGFPGDQPLPDEDAKADTPEAALPSWIADKVAPEPSLPRPLNPSGTRAIIDETLVNRGQQTSPFASAPQAAPPDARVRGTVLHKLLQDLPNIDAAQRGAVASAYLSKRLSAYDADVRQAMWASVEAVFADPRLAGCFDPATSRGEVPLLGTIVTKHGPRPVSGQVDRIAEFAHEVVVLDFKTGAHVPSSEAAIPEDYVAQMALYQDLVARLYGGKPVRCMLVWTHGVQGPVVMEVPQSAMSASLHKIAQL
ncbi:MAG: double-strand break repair helicase AddA [Rhizobiaceae bacterium]|nr:double-strand break repair helicase AddA [Rhizobiaceae bacterium]